MTNEEAITHLENRMHKLKNLYVDRFPRWTNADYVAVHLLLAIQRIMERQPISTEERLPDGHTEILWWHPRTLDWRIGYFWAGSGIYAPGFFKANGAWYVCDGPTWWIPVPPDPTVGRRAALP